MDSDNLSLKMATKNNAETKEGGYRFVICDTHGHLIFA
jgi:hypothetical protein